MGISRMDAGVRGTAFEEWREAIHAICGRFHAETEDSDAFSGWALRRSAVGFDALDIACNVDRIDRGMSDVRRDGVENYYLILQLRGEAVMKQNDETVHLRPGDGVVIDSTRPSSFHYPRQGAHQLSLHLPRRQMIAHLGFQPRGASAICGKSASSKALVALLVGAKTDDEKNVSFKQHAVFDLIGSLLAPDKDHASGSTIHSDQVFERLCAIVRRGARDPDLSVAEVARDAGISVRYLQKLFGRRNASFSHYLHTHRLNEAATLIRRRGVTSGYQSIGQIAEHCGFSGLPYFSRAFRRRFGCAPSAYTGEAERSTRKVNESGAPGASADEPGL